MDVYDYVTATYVMNLDAKHDDVKREEEREEARLELAAESMKELKGEK